MNYFQLLSIIFGSVMILTRPAMHLFPKKWNDFELKIAYTKEQPKWVWYVAMIGLFFVGFTWYKYFTTDVSYSIIITIFFSLTLIKTSQVLFNYQNFRSFATRVLTKDRKSLARINLAVLFLGIALVLMGLLVY